MPDTHHLVFRFRRPPRARSWLLLALAWAAPALATEPPAPEPVSGRRHNACDQLLVAVEAGLGKEGLRTTPFEHLSEERHPTVRATGRRPGAHGGEIVSFRRRGAWASGASTIGFDVQGDPRWFLEVFGPETGRFFGFRLLNDQELELPDVHELNGAIGAVNAELLRRGREPIPTRFYPMPEEVHVKVGTYVSRFLRDRSLPVALKGNHFVHDMSFHSSFIVFPAWFLDEAGASLEYAEAFAEHLKAKYAEEGPELAFAARRYSYLIKLERTMGIDSGSAFLGVELANHFYYQRIGSHAPLHERLGAIVEDFLPELSQGVGFTPLREFSNSLGTTITDRFNPSGMLNLQHTYRAIRALPYLRVKAELQEFSAGYRGALYPGFDPQRLRFATAADRTAFLEKVCAAVTERRREIAEAVRALTVSP